ncbi:MAG TPA: hypothetical protein VLD63_10255 [Anaerolineales bacterium]|nr:hypothetical protein [Anaerolineales bacterium]
MAKTKTGPAVGITEDGLRWEEVSYNGATYRIRELLVEEADTAWDASIGSDKTFNARLNNRLGLCAAIISPPTTIDEIAKWPNVKLVVLFTVFDRLNALPPASAEGEDSAPAT